MATTRYRLTQDVHMKLDGQPQIVLSGTVFDDDAVVQYAAGHVTILSPAEASGTLAAHGKATPVRGVRTR